MATSPVRDQQGSGDTGASQPAPKATAGRRRRGSSRNRRINAWCYLFILPQVVLFVGFVAWPTIASWYFSFFDWDGLGWPTQAIGFDNFREVIKDPFFWHAFRNSMVYAFGMVILVVPGSFIVALVLNNPRLRFRNAYRAMFFLPVVLTSAVIGVEMATLFATQQGFVNNVLQKMGLIDGPVDWLGSTVSAFIVVILVGVWKAFGIKVMYWLAGLQTLPKDVMEAARVDGANRWQTFRYVTAPLMTPFLVVITFLALQQGLHPFDIVKTLTNGGPYYGTDVVPTYIYTQAFASLTLPRMGYASAVGIVYGIATLLLSVIFGGLVKRYGKGIRGGSR